jgi:sulfite exporter TauE/SafE
MTIAASLMNSGFNLFPSVSEQLLNVLPLFVLGFLGSFGHCAGMCGPLVVAFSLTDASETGDIEGINKIGGEPIAEPREEKVKTAKNSRIATSQTCDRSPHWSFQLWLNLGRLLGYAIVGGLLGGIGEATIAGGQLAGVGSGLRQTVAIVTGLLLVWFGVMQVKPKALPPIPLLQPLTGGLHRKISRWMSGFTHGQSGHDQRGHTFQWGRPILLGSLWGLMPCGFLFAAQLKAAGTGSAIAGLLTMLAFGLGTLPVMLGIGFSASWLSADRRGQLFRAAGIVAIAIGGITILRTDAMLDWSGHASLILLSWALVARPLARWWPTPLRYRRAIGVAAFILAIGHLGYQADHSLNWNFDAIRFMLPIHRYGLLAGIGAIVCMTPAALTSVDRLQAALGRTWRRLHLLTVPALICAVGHTILIGSHYLGELSRDASHYGRSGIVMAIALIVLALRSGRFSRQFGRSPAQSPPTPSLDKESAACCHDR